MHVDMDSFFASVEVREHPDLKGKPVVVGADPMDGKGRGVVSTASYEARKFGIHSAMPISRAYACCPHAVFLRPHFDLYTRSSANVMQILGKYAVKCEQVSIDEAYLDVSHMDRYENAEDLALKIKDEIEQKEGLTCSIGIAPMKLVAKIASDFHKPDGLTIVEPSGVMDFLSPLPVEKIPGIGKKTKAELEDLGIYTIGDLAAYNIQALIARFGRWAVPMQNRARGVDNEEVSSKEGYRSISRETTFPDDTEDESLLFMTMDDLAADLYQAIADEQLLFRTITVKVRYKGFDTHTKSRTLEKYSDDQYIIHSVSRELLKDFMRGKKIRLIGLRISSLRCIDPLQKKIDEFT